MYQLVEKRFSFGLCPLKITGKLRLLSIICLQALFELVDFLAVRLKGEFEVE